MKNNIINDISNGIKDYIEKTTFSPDTIRMNKNNFNRLFDLSSLVYCPEYAGIKEDNMAKIFGLNIIIDNNIRDDSCLIYKDIFIKTALI